jgi:uncharacterized protein YvpB
LLFAARSGLITFLTFLLAACAPVVAAPPPETPRAVSITLTATSLSPSPYPSGEEVQATTLTPTAVLTPTSTPLPDSFYIRDISGHKQYFPLGCEAAAAKDWANFFGYDFNEFEFQYKLPLSDNPDLGFVGDVNSPWGQVPPYAYGVHAGPVAELLNQYAVPAKAYKNYGLDDIKKNIAQGKPVIVWVIGNVVGGVPYEYTDSHGNKSIVAAYEHVVIVTGYDETKIRYMNNGKFYDVPQDIFLNSWAVLGNMAIVSE